MARLGRTQHAGQSRPKSLSPADRFELRLALTLGRTVDELRGEMAVDEYEAWREFHRVEPWGEPVADERLRLLASWLCSSFAGKGISPSEFAFGWSSDDEPKRKVDFRQGVKLLANWAKGGGDGGKR